MGVVKTDDAARLLRFIYLGPQDFRWPAASIPAYLTFGFLSALGIGVTFWTRPNLGIWLLLEVPASILLALLVTRMIFKLVDAERGLSYQRRTLAAELRTPRPAKAVAVTTTIPKHLFCDHRERR